MKILIQNKYLRYMVVGTLLLLLPIWFPLLLVGLVLTLIATPFIEIGGVSK